MKKPFVLTPRAEQDIGDIWDYIAVDSIDAADRVLTGLEKAILRLAKTPGIGHLREDLADRRHRFLLVYSYLIVYRFETKPLQIVRVLHAARDVQSILGLPAEQHPENDRLLAEGTGRVGREPFYPLPPTEAMKADRLQLLLQVFGLG
jgi:antitoxin ParD1/3/4/toxin ParE1/3/4